MFAWGLRFKRAGQDIIDTTPIGLMAVAPGLRCLEAVPLLRYSLGRVEHAADDPDTMRAPTLEGDEF
jgi:hypothetical protein